MRERAEPCPTPILVLNAEDVKPFHKYEVDRPEW